MEVGIQFLDTWGDDMKNKKIMGIMFLVLAIFIACYAVYTLKVDKKESKSSGKKKVEVVETENNFQSNKKDAGERIKEKKKKIRIEGKFFETKDGDTSYFFYDKTHCVSTSYTFRPGDKKIPVKNYYTYKVHGKWIYFKNDGIDFDCHFKVYPDKIRIEGYTLFPKAKKDMDKGAPELIGHKFKRGMESYYFISADTLIATLETSESWHYELRDGVIEVLDGKDLDFEEIPFSYSKNQIVLNGDVYKRVK